MEQPKIDDTNWRVQTLHDAIKDDKLFVFRVDHFNKIDVNNPSEEDVLDELTIINFISQYSHKYMCCTERATETKKIHSHVLMILDSIDYGTMSKYFNNWVKYFGLKGGQFSKKKNDYNGLTKSAKMKRILESHGMDSIDYLPCYMCKDFVEAECKNYASTFDIVITEFKRRYDIIQKELNSKDSVHDKKKNPMKILIEKYKQTPMFEKYSDPKKYEDLQKIQTEIFNFVVDFFAEYNKNKPLAQLFTIKRLEMYAFSIIFTYYPSIIKKVHNNVEYINYLE